MNAQTMDCDVVVVGAGFGGLYGVKCFVDAGYSVMAFEAGEGIGGTWFWNRYPGARVDLECWEYSYSFSPDLQDEWDWTERYPTAGELTKYLEHVADRFDLRRHFRFNTRVTAATFDAVDNRWLITTSDGALTRARFLVTATGVLSSPKPPEIPGIETFAGEAYHTGRWPKHSIALSDKRVGVIGTGSSGVQTIMGLAGQVKHLTVFQRTAVYVVPAKNHPLTPEMRARVRAIYMERRNVAKYTRFGVYAALPSESAMEATPEERRKKFENAWENSSLLGFRMCYGDILTNPDANELVAEFIRGKLRETVKDPEVAEKLSPRGFPFGTKRPCLGDTYYDCFNRPDVTLVDLKSKPITHVVPEGVQTADELHELDVLIYATGYDALTGALTRIDITGVNGRTLAEEWTDGAQTYLGLMAAGFPNMFIVTGPGSPGPLANMSIGIEQHIDWICSCMSYMDRRGLVRIDTTSEAAAGWMRSVREIAERTLYMRANSWYLGANVPGKPRVFLPFLGGHGVYRKICDDVATAGYRGFELTEAQVAELAPAK